VNAGALSPIDAEHGFAWGSALVRLFPELPFPKIIFGPPVWQRMDCARLRDLHGGAQHIHEDLPLQRLISHIPEGVANGCSTNNAREGLICSMISLTRVREGAKPGLIQHAMNQSDGLLAYRSGGNEEDEIDGVFLELRGDDGSGFLE
jgi:hypothetical protein